MNSSFSIMIWKKRFKIELSQQKEEEKEKEEQTPLKCMKTSDLQHSFSTVETLTDELYDTDHDREQSLKFKGV